MNSTNYLMEIPKMQGYLQKQVNSFLNFWSTKYYTLDGIMLLSYSDNTLQTLEESISLDGCLVDGIWELEQRYCFTIRSLENQEQLEDFSAESQLEANQWVEKIKQAIVNLKIIFKIFLFMIFVCFHLDFSTLQSLFLIFELTCKLRCCLISINSLKPI